MKRYLWSLPYPSHLAKSFYDTEAELDANLSSAQLNYDNY